MIDRAQLKSETQALGLALSDLQLEMFDAYAEMLVETNKKFNLTAIKNPDEIVTKHFVDSLTVFTAVDIPAESSVIDIGTGAGFPGLPMLIYDSSLNITLLDSTGKKLDFVQNVADELGLRARVVHGRAEEQGRGEHREQFDIAASRAVASLNVLCEYCLPFVRQGGAFIALKGSKAEDELSHSRTAVKTLGGKFICAKELMLADEQTRNLVIIEKAAPTPPKYPRASAQISKKPL